MILYSNFPSNRILNIHTYTWPPCCFCISSSCHLSLTCAISLPTSELCSVVILLFLLKLISELRHVYMTIK